MIVCMVYSMHFSLCNTWKGQNNGQTLSLDKVVNWCKLWVVMSLIVLWYWHYLKTSRVGRGTVLMCAIFFPSPTTQCLTHQSNPHVSQTVLNPWTTGLQWSTLPTEPPRIKTPPKKTHIYKGRDPPLAMPTSQRDVPMTIYGRTLIIRLPIDRQSSLSKLVSCPPNFRAIV